jgi:hypothetical protein
MICSNCKKEIGDESKFCKFCGKKIGKGYAEIVDQIMKGKPTEKQITDRKKIRWEIVLVATAFLLLLIASISAGDNISRGSRWGGNSDSDFYTSLRVYVFIISSYFAYSNYKAEKIGMVFIFVALAILFNPLKLIIFSADFWSVIDFFASLFFIFYSYLIIREYRKIKTRKYA